MVISYFTRFMKFNTVKISAIMLSVTNYNINLDDFSYKNLNSTMINYLIRYNSINYRDIVSYKSFDKYILNKFLYKNLNLIMIDYLVAYNSVNHSDITRYTLFLSNDNTLSDNDIDLDDFSYENLNPIMIKYLVKYNSVNRKDLTQYRSFPCDKGLTVVFFDYDTNLTAEYEFDYETGILYKIYYDRNSVDYKKWVKIHDFN